MFALETKNFLNKSKDTCYCKIKLHNGFITFRAKIIKISNGSINIQIAYKPTLFQALILSEDFMDSESDVKRLYDKPIKVFVKRISLSKNECFEVECDTGVRTEIFRGLILNEDCS